MMRYVFKLKSYLTIACWSADLNYLKRIAYQPRNTAKIIKVYAVKLG